jgi:hypothetical protein
MDIESAIKTEPADEDDWTQQSCSTAELPVETGLCVFCLFHSPRCDFSYVIVFILKYFCIQFPNYFPEASQYRQPIFEHGGRSETEAQKIRKQMITLTNELLFRTGEHAVIVFRSSKVCLLYVIFNIF